VAAQPDQLPGRAPAAADVRGVFFACRHRNDSKGLKVNSDSTEVPLKDSARRRLVRGAFAAPAVLTLCSGSALAAASNERCLANKVTQGQATFLSGPVDGTWLRVQRYMTSDGKTTTYYINGNDVVGLTAGKANLTTYLKAGEYQNISQAPYGKCAKPAGVKADGNNFVAVRVDASGNIQGWAGDGTTAGTSAVPGSCWASFKGF
jgi:hypothetical protein